MTNPMRSDMGKQPLDWIDVPTRISGVDYTETDSREPRVSISFRDHPEAIVKHLSIDLDYDDAETMVSCILAIIFESNDEDVDTIRLQRIYDQVDRYLDIIDECSDKTPS